MKFRCPKCGTRYSIADDKLPSDKPLRFTCKKCRNVVRLKRRRKTDENADAAATANSTRVANLSEIMDLKRRSKHSADDPNPALESAGHGTPFTSTDEWFVLIKGKEKGPFNHHEVERMSAAKQVNERTYVWREGMGDWARLSAVPEFGGLKEKTYNGPTPRPITRRDTDEVALSDTVAMDAGTLHKELDRLHKDEMTPKPGATNLSRLEDAAAMVALLGEPTGEPTTRDAIGFDGAGLNDFAPFGETTNPEIEVPRLEGDDSEELGPMEPGADASYLTAPPGENTLMFMKTAGLQRRGQVQKIAALTGTLFTVCIVTLVCLDIFGYIKIPGMGVMYEATGLEDPNKVRAIERAEEEFHAGETSEARRKELQAKLMGLGGSRDRGKSRATSTPKKDVVGIKDERTLTRKERNFTSDIFSDDRKTERKPMLTVPSEIQTPNLPEGLSQESIFKVITGNQRSMSLCISQSMKAGENLTGKMEVELNIDATGTVDDARIATARFRNTTIGGCTIKTVKRWKFPRFNGEPITVVFPYVLSAAF